MQRLLTLVFLLCLAVPAGISISGCTRNPQGNYCNGEGYGLKLTDVASITLQPQTTGISLAFGQTQQLATPVAKTCKGNTASVSSYTYGTGNNQLVDFSPSGNICAGTWNRRSGGGIPDYTICIKPNPTPSTSGLPYAQTTITATAASVTSNQVTVYVHAQVTAVSLVLEDVTSKAAISGCLSQTQTAQLDSQAFYSNGGNQALLCEPNAPAGSGIPNCSTAIGNFTYNSQNTTIASIDQFGVITADDPGTTYITASNSGSGSSAGYFSTCPPANISVSLNGADSGTVTQGVTQNLVTTIIDTKGNTIQGLTLDYQSTNPLDISAGSGGAITANFAGSADIYAVCQPTTCNPSPINQVGINQTGTPITSNAVTITTPGIASDFVWFSSPQSQYFVPVELVTATVGTAVKMPYFPNSMVMDRTGTNLYFGSSRELMVYATASNSLSKEDLNVPGVVLAAAPNNQTILINDQVRRVFYLYAPASGTFTTFSGIGTGAQWTPDSKTLYVVGTAYSNSGAPIPTLFVNNVNTGWTTYPLAEASSNLALTIPSVGAFLSGASTVMHAWCPQVTPNATTTASGSTTTLVSAYPQVGSPVPAETEVLGATTDGAHILGAGLDGGATTTVTDINVNLAQSLSSGACPSAVNAFTGTPISTKITATPVTSFVQTALPIAASAIDQVVTSPGSSLAFITYMPSGAGVGTLPYYEPTTSGSLGAVGTVTLAGAPTAPIVGAFSLDNTLFFVSTAGDNLVHYVTVKTLTDTQQIKPGLVDGNGNAVPARFIAVKPRATT